MRISPETGSLPPPFCCPLAPPPQPARTSDSATRRPATTNNFERPLLLTLYTPCMRPVKCVKVPCRSTPQCSLARHQLRLFGQLLLPSIQLRQGSGAEIAF